jgi:hypothetical protein
MSGAVECPTCGGPAREVPVDPRAVIRCGWCGTSYERERADASVEALRRDIAEWLRKTTGVSANEGAGAVDVATRTFLFNDRILPGLRRDLRRVLDERIGDVDGAPIVVPPLLHYLAGFRADDALLVTRRDAVLELRALGARIEADEVAAFATTAADTLTLSSLRKDIDRTMAASNAATALSHGISAGAAIARTNLAELARRSTDSAVEAAADPAAAALTRAVRTRAESLDALLSALGATPPDPAAMHAAARRLDETAQWLLTSDTRSLRTALASTGIQRDATAARVLAGIADAMQGTGTSVVQALDALAPLSRLLSATTRPRDAAALVHAWATALAARVHRRGLPAITDTTWVDQTLSGACAASEQIVRADVILVPHWIYPVRHTETEGVFLVSGKQKEALAIVPASGGAAGTTLIPRDQPRAAYVDRAVRGLVAVDLPIEPPSVGPEAARMAAKAELRKRDVKNVTLGDPALLYVPLALAQIGGPRAVRSLVLGPFDEVRLDPSNVFHASRALDAAARMAQPDATRGPQSGMVQSRGRGPS